MRRQVALDFVQPEHLDVGPGIALGDDADLAAEVLQAAAKRVVDGRVADDDEGDAVLGADDTEPQGVGTAGGFHQTGAGVEPSVLQGFLDDVLRREQFHQAKRRRDEPLLEPDQLGQAHGVGLAGKDSFRGRWHGDLEERVRASGLKASQVEVVVGQRQRGSLTAWS